MSLLKTLNITEALMATYSPLGQLSKKYLAQVLKRGIVIAFEAGETVFNKQKTLDDDNKYYLLAGKLKVKTGLFSSEILDANAPNCLNAVNNKIPHGSSAKALEKGHMLMIDELFLDRALGWSEVERDRIDNPQKQQSEDSPQFASTNKKEETNPFEPSTFDEGHFTWITSLMEFPLFFNLPPSNMEMLLTKFCKQEVSAEQVIIKEGDEGDYFYLLMEGSARVIIGGDETSPIRLNRGSFFGEEALISDSVRSATIIMSEDGLLARLDKASFQSLLNDPLVERVPKQQFNVESMSGSSPVLLDIRSAAEFAQTNIPNCTNIPLADLRQKIPSLDNSKVYYLTEEGGHRSDIAAHILCQNSFKAKVIKS